MKKHIVCFGDSNTHGYCADPNDTADHTDRFTEDERWTCLLQKALGEDYLVLEEGLSGRTTVFRDPLHECMSGLDVIYSTLMTHEPVDLLIIMLGTNDLKEHSAQASVNGVGTLIRTIQTFDQLYPASVPLFGDNKPRILVLTPIEIGENVAEWDTLYGKGQESRKFPALMKGLCEWLGVEMMNTQEIVQPSKVDGIHMMPEEHRKLALAVKEKLLAMMAK